MRASRLPGSLACFLALALAAAGCGLSGGSDDGEATAGGCKVDKANVGSGALTGDVKGDITFQTTNLKKDFGDYFNGVIDAFEKEHPGTKVKWIDDPGDATFTQRLVADAQGCTLPDVVNINVNTAVALTKNGYLLNLDKKAPDAGKPFTESMWKSSTYAAADGTEVHSVLPWYSGGIVQTFNNDLLKKAGLDPAKPPTSILGLFADAEKMAKASDGKYFAFLANPQLRIPADWQQMGIEVLSADGKKFTFADDPKTVQWVEGMTKLYKAGAMPKDSLSSTQDPSNVYGQGKLAYGPTNPNFLRFIQQNNPSVYKKTGVARYPLDDLGHTVGAPQYIGVASTSKNAVTALAFARFLTNAKNQLQWAKDPNVVIFPSTTESLKDPFFQKVEGTDPFAEARKIVASDRQTATADEIALTPGELNAVSAQIQLAMQGKKSAQDALDEAQSKANALIEQAG
ncbi:sugar ABC transporter substrate-binding protein [Streptomyces sp. DT2A-34]|uniref:ABC transporter substrate-binding protein n=1 Tax=Streptomyces sp. DT2A-34 TaxID=3051182 RepID=UPI00265BB17D|nr:sugar ABC transporter substrate-binding protein [Streptomyces sp. DT2A-34]MDO0910849.1 sugar ABC transporter substrate-binding protein [Streptomyces sp. DT2A-34]